MNQEPLRLLILKLLSYRENINRVAIKIYLYGNLVLVYIFLTALITHPKVTINTKKQLAKNLGQSM